VLLSGSAGTGKTMLALWDACQMADNGLRVMFCCRSPLLARQIGDSPAAVNLDVVDASSLMLRCIGSRSESLPSLPDARDEDMFNIFLPDAALEAVLNGSLTESVDALVVDEAQDLISEGIMDLFDALLVGGLSQGTWRFFLDPHQNVFSAINSEQLTHLSSLTDAKLELSRNCRNTAQVAAMTSIMSSISADEMPESSGPDVETAFVTSAANESREVRNTITSWTSKGIVPSEIVVIDVKAKSSTSTPPLLGELLESFPSRAGKATWVPLADFKGLEAKAVIVIGVDDLISLESRRALYVACSRARVMLKVIMNGLTSDDFAKNATNFALQQESEDL